MLRPYEYIFTTINYQLSTINRSRVPDARTTTLNSQLLTPSSQ
ncbi:MAG: hypothetical protein ACRC62_34435 [Microcoleus sp.]